MNGSPDMYGDASVSGASTTQPGAAPELGMAPGMIITGLSPGEEIGMIDSNRPNPNLITFRGGPLRAVAAGVGASYSSLARDYDGTYSAQRQELVEQWVHYAVLTDEFVGQYVQPVWQDFVLTAHLSGVVPRPRDVDPDSADDALFVGQSMPWIDPLKEASAWLALVQAGFASEVEVMRKRGANQIG
jgi:lambda family phage portal protein